VHGGDHRLGQIPDGLGQGRRVADVLTRGHGLQVSPGAEGTSVTAKDHRTDRVITRRPRQPLAEAVVHGTVDRVERLGPVQDELGHAVGAAVEHSTVRQAAGGHGLGLAGSSGLDRGGGISVHPGLRKDSTDL
jgi:hypothetical protein